MITVFLSTLLVTSVIWWAFKNRKPPSLPPGPISLPVIGSLPFLRGDIRKAFCRMSQTYGDVFTMDMGSRRTIVLASYASIKEALVNKALAFSGRPMTIFIKEIGVGKGIVYIIVKSYLHIKCDILATKEYRRWISIVIHHRFTHQIDGLVQERRNSIADAMELRLSCTNPSKCRYTPCHL